MEKINQSNRERKRNDRRRRKRWDKKTELVFDEAARADYLTGFQKRKKERKKVAKEKLIKEMKEEIKRIKKQKRDTLKSLFEDDLGEPEIPEGSLISKFDLPKHVVTITDMSQADIAGGVGTRLGINKEKGEDKAPTERKNIHTTQKNFDRAMKEVAMKSCGKRRRRKNRIAKAKITSRKKDRE